MDMTRKTAGAAALPSVPDPPPERDWRRLRQASQFNLPLPTAHRWVALLPGEIQPRALLRQFPRIVNNMATLWSNRQSFEQYLNRLLIDERGNRQGFPPDVHIDLLNLRDYIEGRYGNLPPP